MPPTKYNQYMIYLILLATVWVRELQASRRKEGSTWLLKQDLSAWISGCCIPGGTFSVFGCEEIVTEPTVGRTEQPTAWRVLFLGKHSVFAIITYICQMELKSDEVTQLKTGKAGAFYSCAPTTRTVYGKQWLGEWPCSSGDFILAALEMCVSELTQMPASSFQLSKTDG